jgi:hypothetical protein
LDDALVALERLHAITALLPSASLLLYSFVRKEAVLSFQIPVPLSTWIVQSETGASP